MGFKRHANQELYFLSKELTALQNRVRTLEQSQGEEVPAALSEVLVSGTVHDGAHRLAAETAGEPPEEWPVSQALETPLPEQYVQNLTGVVGGGGG
jgi:hypothetical protein